MALDAGNSACTTGLSGALYTAWTGDATNGFSSPLTTGQTAVVKSLCYQWAVSIAARLGVDGAPRTGAYAAGTTYAAGDLCTDAGAAYISLASSNTGHTPASSPTWWGALGGSSGPATGLDTALPTPLTGEYLATDTGVVYVGNGSTIWTPHAGPHAIVPCSSDFADGSWVSATLSGAGPNWGAGCSFVAMLWPVSVPGSVVLLAQRTGVSFHQIRFGDGADKGRAYVYYGSPYALPANHTVTGGLGAPHVLAFTHTGGNLRSSWDGGAVGVTAATATTPVGGVLSLGGDSGGSFRVTTIQVIHARIYSTVLSDADLQAVGSAAGRTARYLPAATGTVTFEYHARWVERLSRRAYLSISGVPTLFTAGWYGVYRANR
jgi:hypothetical protein